MKSRFCYEPKNWQYWPLCTCRMRFPCSIVCLLLRIRREGLKPPTDWRRRPGRCCWCCLIGLLKGGLLLTGLKGPWWLLLRRFPKTRSPSVEKRLPDEAEDGLLLPPPRNDEATEDEELPPDPVKVERIDENMLPVSPEDGGRLPPPIKEAVEAASEGPLGSPVIVETSPSKPGISVFSAMASHLEQTK